MARIMMELSSALAILLLVLPFCVEGFNKIISTRRSALYTATSWTKTNTALGMVLDDSMIGRLDGIKRSYNALTERLGDPDVLEDSKLLQKVMSDRASIDEVVQSYDEYCRLLEEMNGATELFQDAGDDIELKEMARTEMKEIEPQLDRLEDEIKVLLLPKDPNDDRNVMIEIRAGTGVSCF